MKLKEYLKSPQEKARFAERMSVTRVTVTRWLNGTRYPNPENMRRMKEITAGQVTANDFYS